MADWYFMYIYPGDKRKEKKLENLMGLVMKDNEE